MDKKQHASKLRRFAAYYRPHMGLFLLDLFCALLIALIDVLYPLFSNLALKEYLPAGRYEAFFLVVFFAALAYVFRAGMEYVVMDLGHMVGVHMEADMRRDIFTHLQTLSHSFYNRSRVGTLMSNCTHDLFEITELAHHGPEDLLVSVLTFIGSVAVMFTIEWRLALVLLMALPALCAITILLRRRMRQSSRRVKESIAGINARIESSISGIRVAQAFCNEAYEVEKFTEGNARFIQARGSHFKNLALFFTGMEFCTTILKVVVLGLGGYMIIHGRMDLVDLVTFFLYVSSFTAPIRKLTSFSETYVAGMAGFSRFLEVLDTEPEIRDLPGALSLPRIRGEVEFENVSFSYDTADAAERREVLHEVSFRLAAGETLALVGASGGGKTTICHLIPRFYEPSRGKILVDGTDIRNLQLHFLRQNVGIVQQDVFLFADTVYENIRYGRLDATEEEIIAAAKAAEIHEEILAMPQGYQSLVGERGVTLSGGQKQRISIARIFLKNPPILILDEATSALDSVTEERISAALKKLSQGRSTLIIAHRLSTVRHANQILVVENGRILERGCHDALLQKDGEYARLYRAQQLF